MVPRRFVFRRVQAPRAPVQRWPPVGAPCVRAAGWVAAVPGYRGAVLGKCLSFDALVPRHRHSWWHWPGGRGPASPLRSASSCNDWGEVADYDVWQAREAPAKAWKQPCEPWRDVLVLATLGHELQGCHLRMAEKLLHNHPEVEKLVGVGLKSIKVDLPPSSGEAMREPRCFWVLRTDGSSQAFSTERCADSIRSTRRCSFEASASKS